MLLTEHSRARPVAVSGAAGLPLLNSSSVQVAYVASEPGPRRAGVVSCGPRVLCHSGGAGPALPVPSRAAEGRLTMEVAQPAAAASAEPAAPSRSPQPLLSRLQAATLPLCLRHLAVSLV